MAQHAPARAAPPVVSSSRRGIRLRDVRGSPGRTYWECEHVGELERLRDKLSGAEFDAGVSLRGLWRRGCMNPEATASAMDRLGMPRSGFSEHEANDERDTAQDRLRAAMRAMGGFGMYARFAVDVVAYERRCETDAEIDTLREALGRLAVFLWSKPRCGGLRS